MQFSLRLVQLFSLRCATNLTVDAMLPWCPGQLPGSRSVCTAPIAAFEGLSYKCVPTRSPGQLPGSRHACAVPTAAFEGQFYKCVPTHGPCVSNYAGQGVQLSSRA